MRRNLNNALFNAKFEMTFSEVCISSNRSISYHTKLKVSLLPKSQTFATNQLLGGPRILRLALNCAKVQKLKSTCFEDCELAIKLISIYKKLEVSTLLKSNTSIEAD